MARSSDWAAGRDRTNVSGRLTGSFILLTAERRRGAGHRSGAAREIGLAAGQKNNFAVQYHFGDRRTSSRRSPSTEPVR